MLVKFKTKNTGDSVIRIDSSKIYSVGNKIFEYNTLNDASWTVDDVTLAYLQNAWAHEGMRRVLVVIADSLTPYIREEQGWLSEISENIFLDTGERIKAIDVDSYSLIPYEMEEQV
ncbi:MAG: hypothetical protein WC549_02010 [Actinomycetota bacterium]